MARKETIYTVNHDTNKVIRASKTLLAAYEFAAKLDRETYYICTSEFQDLKKGDIMSNIVDFL